MTHPVSSHTLEINSVSSARQQQTQTAELSQKNGDSLQLSASTSLSKSAVVTLQNTESTRPVHGPNAAQALNPQSTANNILQFISQRLAQFKQQGATTEQLEDKLEQAKEGFEQGVAESVEALQSLGLLSVEQEKRIDKIVSRFNQGIEDIAANLNATASNLKGDVNDATQNKILGAAYSNDKSTQTTPKSNIHTTVANGQSKAEPEAVRSSNEGSVGFISRFQQSQAAFSRQESLDLQLRTQDGDTVTVRFFSQQSGSSSLTVGQFGNSHFQLGFSKQFTQAFSGTELQISVNGEIDDDELAALESLFAQLSEIASAFFNAEDGEAFSQSLNLDVNSDEIAQFSFDLQSREVQQITQRYREVAAINHEGSVNRGHRHGHGYQGLLQQLRDQVAERSTISFEQQFVEQLLSVSFAAASVAVDSGAAMQDESVSLIEAVDVASQDVAEVIDSSLAAKTVTENALDTVVE